MAKKAITSEQTADLPAKPPPTLGKHGRKLWALLRRDYPHLTQSDAGAVTSYCAAFDLHEEMSEVIATEGAIVTNSKGDRKPNAAVEIRGKAAATMTAVSAKIGIACSSRVQVRKADRPTRTVTAKPVNRTRKAEEPLDFAAKAAALADRMVANG